MEIAHLEPSQKKQAAKAVAGAFYEYPSLVHYFPDPKRRTRRLAWYMEGILTAAMLFGEVWTAGGTAGVLFILPPGHTRLTDRDYFKSGMLTAPLKVGLRHYYSVVGVCERYLADTQERLLAGRPHYYLWGLAVDPAVQRTGAGTALLEVLLKKTDAEKLPVYLETHKAANVPYYEKHGFRLMSHETVPKHDMEFWCLLHEPE